MTDIKDDVTLAYVVGYLLSSLDSISDLLSNGDQNKAASKVFEGIKFIKDNMEIITQHSKPKLTIIESNNE